MNKLTALILAAGKGTRMKSNKAKVLHEVFFRPMIHHVMDAIMGTQVNETVVIVGHQHDWVLDTIKEYTFTPVVQKQQLGTGHAVLCAEEACAASDTVLILCGDTPLMRSETLDAMIGQHRESNSVLTLMTTKLNNPFGYGRILTDEQGKVKAVPAADNRDKCRHLSRGPGFSFPGAQTGWHRQQPGRNLPDRYRRYCR